MLHGRWLSKLLQDLFPVRLNIHQSFPAIHCWRSNSEHRGSGMREGGRSDFLPRMQSPARIRRSPDTLQTLHCMISGGNRHQHVSRASLPWSVSCLGNTFPSPKMHQQETTQEGRRGVSICLPCRGLKHTHILPGLGKSLMESKSSTASPPFFPCKIPRSCTTHYAT